MSIAQFRPVAAVGEGQARVTVGMATNRDGSTSVALKLTGSAMVEFGYSLAPGVVLTDSAQARAVGQALLDCADQLDAANAARSKP